MVERSDSAPGPALVDAMVAELRVGEGEAGRFSLDLAEAEKKLRGFEMPNPLHWSVLALRGAVRSGASRIDVRTAHRRLVMRWQAPLELPDDPTEAIDAAAGRVSGGLRQLILAAFAGVNAGLERVVLSAGTRRLVIDREGVHSGERRPGADVSLEAFGRVSAPLDRRRAEAWVLRKRGRYLDAELWVDGERASFGAKGDVDFDATPLRGVKLPPGMLMAGTTPGRAEARLLVDRVWVESRPLDGVRNGFVAVLDAGFTLDAADTRVVRDEALERALNDARRLGMRGPIAKVTRDAIRKRLLPAPEDLAVGFVPAALLVLPLEIGLSIVAMQHEYTDEIAANVIFTLMYAAMGSAAWGVFISFGATPLRGRLRWRGARRRLPPHHPARDLSLEVPHIDDEALARMIGVGLITVAVIIGSVVFALTGGPWSFVAAAVGVAAPFIGLLAGNVLGAGVEVALGWWKREPRRLREPEL